MINPTPLSRAAQAVMNAATNGNTNVVNDPVYKQCIAVALRAAAENFLMDWDAIQCCDFLLDIADELEVK